MVRVERRSRSDGPEGWSLRLVDHRDLIAHFLPLVARAGSRESRRRFVVAFARIALERATECIVAEAWLRGLIETLEERGGRDLVLAFVEAGQAQFPGARRALENPDYAAWRRVIATWTGEETGAGAWSSPPRRPVRETPGQEGL